MKKYELKKCSAEFAWKERKEIKEGCTMYDVEPERLGEFESLEKQRKSSRNMKPRSASLAVYSL